MLQTGPLRPEMFKGSKAARHGTFPFSAVGHNVKIYLAFLAATRVAAVAGYFGRVPGSFTIRAAVIAILRFGASAYRVLAFLVITIRHYFPP